MAKSIEQLDERIGELQTLIESGALHGRHGKHGRDGDPGRPGRDGRDGKDADPIVTAELVQKAVDAIPRPQDGKDGRDGADCDMERVEALVGVKASEIEGRIRIPRDGIDGAQGKAGERGKEGPPGPEGKRGPIGPMPRHEWSGTELRFEIRPGEWGQFVDLQGPQGRAGLNGRNGGGGGGAAAATTTAVNGYFPQGWQ